MKKINKMMLGLAVISSLGATSGLFADYEKDIKKAQNMVEIKLKEADWWREEVKYVTADAKKHELEDQKKKTNVASERANLESQIRAEESKKKAAKSKELLLDDEIKALKAAA